mmetsp:Transcript_637/g.1085  ORF Transcript_637/g.1085 Transcript_637/m.1085 type:complete len:495 (+) Transcript_637:80-1564(+)|eukprot:CAMPEP_0184675776 /NCGR_PEP_ID=MMETSP0308-20130426/87979_1 /TAXON_ID=38269 /ORGANISM="Gloeochaete witrockiana, Strain SAG 46.84" /LENGTH=494 /DNA_ID=CAMNT_0027123525 /DNA_START=17 /DNA_END=1501 /DNA_ORIENTATION=-
MESFSPDGPESWGHFYDEALSVYLSQSGDPTVALSKGLSLFSDSAMLRSFLASMYLLGQAQDSHNLAARELACCPDNPSRRDQQHMEALQHWIEEKNWRGAVVVWETILVTDPTDLLALRLLVDSCFYFGEYVRMRDAVARVLPFWHKGMAHYGKVLGLYAFALEETGDYRRAEVYGRAGVGEDPYDAWSVHAVVHVLEMECRQQEGVQYLKELSPYWTKSQVLSVHLHWHNALFELELENKSLSDILEYYDTHLHRPGLPLLSVLDLVDCASLLWRLELLGQDVEDRWTHLTDFCDSMLYTEIFPLNHLHMFLCYIAAGNSAKAEELLSYVRSTENALKATLNNEPIKRRHTSSDIPPAEWVQAGALISSRVLSEVLAPTLEGLFAFKKGRWEEAMRLLVRTRYDWVRLGGSAAQRDLLVQTLIMAAVRDQRHSLARSLLSERIALKAGSPRTWRLLKESIEAEKQAYDSKDQLMVSLEQLRTRQQVASSRAE